MGSNNYEIPAFLLSLVCFIYCITAKRRQYIPPRGIAGKLTNQHFVFLLMLTANMLSAASSVTGAYFAAVSPVEMHFLRFILHEIYFVAHTSLSIAFALYIINATGMREDMSSLGLALFSLPYAVSECVILTNPLTGWAFYMDAESVYHRGPLMLILYGAGLLYIILGFVFFFKKRSAVSHEDSIAVGAFIVIAAIGIAVQAVYPGFLVELFFEALACLIIMVVLEEKSGHIDSATGLLNRAAFSDTYKRLIASKQRFDIVIFKIDDVERLINKFSSRGMDAFLMKIAAYLSDVADTKNVFCYRREEFAVIFPDLKLADANDFIERLFTRFDSDWKVDRLRIKADITATLLRIPEDIQTAEELENVLSERYEKSKPGSYLVPFEDLRELTRTSLYERSLRKAVADGKLTLNYQPIWSASEKRVVSAEALLRVDYDELCGISPEIYIPIAEKTGLIRDIGFFIFEEVCKTLADERIQKTGIRHIALNLSAYQFMYSDLIESFERIRERYGIESSRINLEITETAAAHQEHYVTEYIRRFRDLGYSVSLDDFGTGYSNLIRMIESKYENIKIDKSILWKVVDKSDSRLLHDITTFIKTLGSEIVQEGIETKEQLDLAVACGCDYVQGFYFSKPLCKEDLIKYLEDQRQ